MQPFEAFAASASAPASERNLASARSKWLQQPQGSPPAATAAIGAAAFAAGSSAIAIASSPPIGAAEATDVAAEVKGSA